VPFKGFEFAVCANPVKISAVIRVKIVNVFMIVEN
jgi:hypothetical protein